MSAFDKVIGYETIKNELQQICDMILNKEIYERLGARMPQGMMLYGNPGLGKTLMAKCFLEDSGLTAYTIRRNKGNNDFIGEITETFRKAKENAPCIVFLDDMDKFANEDSSHCDAQEYVAIQAGIDEIKDSGVFVLATANEIRKLPRSLVRSGRFDRKIEVQSPTSRDAREIIAYYLADKKVSEQIDLDDLSGMISYSSCAELETILNEAAIYAASERKLTIEMKDIVKAVLRMQYDSPDNFTKISEEEMKKTALHEAGHLVVSEVLCPGSVGLASLRSNGREATGGFIHQCKEMKNTSDLIRVALAGKEAVNMYDAEGCAGGCWSDIHRACCLIRDSIANDAMAGLGMIDPSTDLYCNADVSENMKARSEAAALAELERYALETRKILFRNRNFLEKAAQELLEKETLLLSDIRRIRENCLPAAERAVIQI